MTEPCGIIVFGANGSGKSTIGSELARILNFKHMDIEEYCFKESEIPYTNARSHEEYIELMLADIERYRLFVVSAVIGDLCEKISSFYKLAVFLFASIEVRMKRIEQRENNKFGNRVREGGDRHEQHLKFINFAASRDLTKIDAWKKTLTCPIINIDGEKDWRANAALISEYWRRLDK